MSRIFWTCVLPESLISKYKLSFAASNFSFNLMSGSGFDRVYSMMPLYVGGEMDQEAFEDNRFELIYDKLRKRGGFWKKLAVLKEQWIIFRQIPRDTAVWFYNLNTLNAFLFILLKLFKPSVQLNVIVLDFTPVMSGWGLNRIYLRFINMAHGRICLANSPLFKSYNSAILPGVIPANHEGIPPIKDPEKDFLLSGVLSEEIAQLSLVLKTFSQLPECDLYITGNKGDENLLKEYSEKYSNIHWCGQLAFPRYMELLHKITFQLSTRDPKAPENQCNFPSKIIEALLHNRVVVSTIHYPQLNGIQYIEVESNAEAFLQGVQTILRMADDELLTYANQGELVSQLFDVHHWYKIMNDIERSGIH